MPGVQPRARVVLSRHLGVLITGACIVLAACGPDKTTAPAGPTPPGSPGGSGAGDTVTFDLRFKGVGLLTTDSGVAGSANVFCDSAECTGGKFVASGTPIAVGSGLCDPSGRGGCSWPFDLYALPSTVSGVTITYLGGVLSDLAADLDSAATIDTVITGLDLEPVDGVWGYSAYVTASKGGYNRTHHVVSAAGLQAAATAAGSQGRVITAVSFDSGQVHYLSYGWSLAQSTTYDAQVVTATPSTIAASAQSLAAAGFFITAVGGDTADGFLLIGTRIHGVTTARSVQTTTVDLSIPGSFRLPSGAIVGLVITGPTLYNWITEE